VTVYLDTSVLVKLYLDESDAGDVQQLVSQATVVVTSVVAYAEARAAFARRRRARQMTSAEAEAVVRQLDLDWRHLVRIALDDELARLAGRLAETHALRGYDAVHLASFQVLLERCGDDDVQFSCADARLAEAARSLG
jgi:predicted nucleic acid-binding protein